MKHSLRFALSFVVMFILLASGLAQADWDTKNKGAAIKLSHKIDQMLHSFHQEIGALDPKHFDKDFSDTVHQLDHAIHDFHELLAKNNEATAALILEDFKEIELKYREANAVFVLAHKIHSDKKAGLAWMDFLRSYEELHYLVTGHFSWQDVEFDHHIHDHGHDSEHGADHGHDH